MMVSRAGAKGTRSGSIPASLVAVSLLATSLAACNTNSGPPVAVTPSVAISIIDLRGDWGLERRHDSKNGEKLSAFPKVGEYLG